MYAVFFVIAVISLLGEPAGGKPGIKRQHRPSLPAETMETSAASALLVLTH